MQIPGKWPRGFLVAGRLACGAVILGLVAAAVSAQPPAPDLRVEKSCRVDGPQSVLCTVTITNIGARATSSTINLTDTPTAPAGATFTGSSGNASCSPGAGPVLPITCTNIQSLQPGASVDVLFGFRAGPGGTFSNCATASQPRNAATVPDSDPSNNTNICTKLDLGAGDPQGPIEIDTPDPAGACAITTQVSGMHYPQQSCAQSTPAFLAGMMTSYHLRSKCPNGTQLLGVTDASCQDAPIPGFPTGSVYQATACCGRVSPPSSGKITIVKKIGGDLSTLGDPGPFVVQVKCDPAVPQQSVSLSAPGFTHVLAVAQGAKCEIREVTPRAPKGCRWITTYPNGQAGKDGDTLVVQNELSCAPPPPTCPRGQALTTFPGSDVTYCCNDKVGSDSFCCNRSK